jgi:hypothetical protein
MNTPYDHPSWTFVWNTLMNANPDHSEIADMGRQWLMSTSHDHPSWALVWNTLMNANPYDSHVADMGRQWLLKD